MGKDFLKSKTEQKKIQRFVLGVGTIITIVMAVNAYKKTEIKNGYELAKKEVGEGSYEQPLIAQIDGVGEIPLEVMVDEKVLSEEEAEQIFQDAILVLEEFLLGENESFNEIKKDLYFLEKIPNTPVEVMWTRSCLEYFDSDGRIREDIEFLEPLELNLSAVLSCQSYTKDYEKQITIYPKDRTTKSDLTALLNQSREENLEEEFLKLPTEYNGKQIVWKKPLDKGFLAFGILTFGTVLFLKIGSKQDLQQEKIKRLEDMEKDYAQIVSKFSMLLTAGLSVRNAWERIVLMNRGKTKVKRAIDEEMNWALRELQKGVSELEVYEKFGVKVGLVPYKKLMAMFIFHKKRGGIDLLERMNQEMLLAWEEEKRKTRQLGEKIGTKLLVPMMGMLMIVFIMILIPAFLSFQF